MKQQMKDEKKDAVVLDDDALDKVYGGTSTVPVLHPDMLLSKHQLSTASDTAVEVVTGINLNQIVIVEQTPRQETDSTISSLLAGMVDSDSTASP